MKRTRFVFTVILLLSWWPRPAQAASTASHVVISELQTGTTANASQEFIELYNPTNQAVALDGWQLQYHPATTTGSWTNHTSGGLKGSIPADGFYLIAPTTYLANADANFSSGMAAGGGSVQLVDGNGNVIDLLGWGTAVVFEHLAAAVPASSGSLERLPGLTNPNAGNGIDIDDNSADFVQRPIAEPQSTTGATELPGEALALPISTSPGGTATAPTGGTTATTSDSSDIQINELLIDPVSPKTDAKDEFIELYNPGASAVNLKGYKLKTGSNFHDSYTLPDVTIASGGYLTLYSSQTKLALTNSGGAAELLDSGGNVIDVSATYDGSLAGLSFSRFGDDWQWTQTLTPGVANQFVAPATAATTKAKAAAAKKASTKSTAKTTKAKAAAKTVKAPKTAGTLVAGAAQQAAGMGAKWLIIGLAALTMGYAIYEFRYDLQNYLVIARRKYGAWRQTRHPVGWRRDH